MDKNIINSRNLHQQMYCPDSETNKKIDSKINRVVTFLKLFKKIEEMRKYFLSNSRNEES